MHLVKVTQLSQDALLDFPADLRHILSGDHDIDIADQIDDFYGCQSFQVDIHPLPTAVDGLGNIPNRLIFALF
jgi:hypothetical protein